MKIIKLFFTLFLGISFFTFSQDNNEEAKQGNTKGSLIKQFEFPIRWGNCITSDGEYLYIAQSSNPYFKKYDINGNLIGDEFLISGISGALTIAYDGRYVWASRYSSLIHKIDMQANPPVRLGYITAPFEVQYMTFDPNQDEGNGGFWIGNKNHDIVLIDLNGNELTTIASGTHGLEDIYSIALDNINPGGSFLWTMKNNSYSGALLRQIKLPEGFYTGESYDFFNEGITDYRDIGNGICIVSDIIPGTTSLIVVIENKAVMGFDISGLDIKDYDIGVFTNTMPSHIPGDADYTVSGTVRNYGSENITSYSVYYSIDDGEPQVYEVSDVLLEPKAQLKFTHPVPVKPVIGSHIIKTWTSMPNGNEDEFQANDMKEYFYIVYDVNATAARTILIEAFSSVTCSGCASSNEHLKKLLEENQGKYTLVKYQTNWPGVGDPYFTNEVDTRRAYYGINSVPYLHLEGSAYNNYPSLLGQNTLLDFQNILAFIELEVEYYVLNQTVYTKTKINPLVDISGNLSLYSAIIEKRTERNSVTVPDDTYGEKEFFNVLKKFIPDDKGVTINSLSAFTPYILEQEWEFKGDYRLPFNSKFQINHAIEHSVEDFGNLTIAAWVQNEDDKSVFQAANGILTHATVNYETINDFGYISAFVNGNPIEQNELLEANSEVTLKVEINEGYEVKEWKLNNSTVENNFSDELVFTLNRNSKITVEFQPKSGICDKLLSNIKLFPNPVNKNLTITNSENIKKITITNVFGQTVKEINITGESNIIINTDELVAGVYIVTVQLINGEKANYRIVKA